MKLLLQFCFCPFVSSGLTLGILGSGSPGLWSCWLLLRLSSHTSLCYWYEHRFQISTRLEPGNVIENQLKKRKKENSGCHFNSLELPRKPLYYSYNNVLIKVQQVFSNTLLGPTWLFVCSPVTNLCPPAKHWNITDYLFVFFHFNWSSSKRFIRHKCALCLGLHQQAVWHLGACLLL